MLYKTNSVEKIVRIIIKNKFLFLKNTNISILTSLYLINKSNSL